MQRSREKEIEREREINMYRYIEERMRYIHRETERKIDTQKERH